MNIKKRKTMQIAISDEVNRLFCELDLAQSKPGNTIHNHALLPESQVRPFATFWSSTETSKDIPSLAFEGGGDGKVRSKSRVKLGP